jgi:hypothetical protein
MPEICVNAVGLRVRTRSRRCGLSQPSSQFRTTKNRVYNFAFRRQTATLWMRFMQRHCVSADGITASPACVLSTVPIITLPLLSILTVIGSRCFSVANSTCLVETD